MAWGPPSWEMGPGLGASSDLQPPVTLSSVLASVASVLPPSLPPLPRAEAGEGVLPQAEGPALTGRGFPRVSLSPVPLSRARGSFMGPRGSPSRCSGPNRPQNSWRTQGGTGRQHHVLMEIQLSKVSWGLRVRKASWEGDRAGPPIPGTQPACHHGPSAPGPWSGTRSLSACRAAATLHPRCCSRRWRERRAQQTEPCLPVTCVVGEGAPDLCGVDWGQCLGKVNQGGGIGSAGEDQHSLLETVLLAQRPVEGGGERVRAEGAARRPGPGASLPCWSHVASRTAAGPGGAVGLTGNQVADRPADHRTVLAFTRVRCGQQETVATQGGGSRRAGDGGPILEKFGWGGTPGWEAGRHEAVRAEVLLPEGEAVRALCPSARGCRAEQTQGLSAASGAGEPALGRGEGRPGQSPEDEKGLELFEGQERGQWGWRSGARWRERPGPSRPRGGVCRAQGGWACAV